MRRFFIALENFQTHDGGMVEVQIRGEDAHHIRNVLRMAVGDRLVLFDGSGVEYESVIIALSDDARRGSSVGRAGD
jgi:16S rRNA (uracil1498-N3)-methyltransferase